MRGQVHRQWAVLCCGGVGCQLVVQRFQSLVPRGTPTGSTSRQRICSSSQQWPGAVQGQGFCHFSALTSSKYPSSLSRFRWKGSQGMPASLNLRQAGAALGR